ncbi:uncharacterized protein [Oscarella lobularis]
MSQSVKISLSEPTPRASKIDKAIALVRKAAISLPGLKFYKFSTLNVGDAAFSGASNAFTLEEISTVLFFGEGGVFETPTEAFLRSYPDALVRLYDASTPEFFQNYSDNVLETNVEKEKEHEKELKLLREVVLPLCGGKCLVLIHRKPRSTVRKYTGGLQSADLAMGNSETWHGYLDAVAKPDEILTEVPVSFFESPSDNQCDSESEDHDEEEGGANSDEPSSRLFSETGCNLDFKVELEEKRVRQTVSECVMFSFIHHSRHKEQPSLVPTLLFDGRSFYVVMYDCVADVLLISGQVMIVEKNTVNLHHVALFWAVLHHRVVLRERKEYKEDLRELSGALSSGFHETCRATDRLELYKSLHEYDHKKPPEVKKPLRYLIPFDKIAAQAKRSKWIVSK